MSKSRGSNTFNYVNSWLESKIEKPGKQFEYFLQQKFASIKKYGGDSVSIIAFLQSGTSVKLLNFKT